MDETWGLRSGVRKGFEILTGRFCYAVGVVSNLVILKALFDYKAKPFWLGRLSKRACLFSGRRFGNLEGIATHSSMPHQWTQTQNFTCFSERNSYIYKGKWWENNDNREKESKLFHLSKGDL